MKKTFCFFYFIFFSLVIHAKTDLANIDLDLLCDRARELYDGTVLINETNQPSDSWLRFIRKQCTFWLKQGFFIDPRGYILIAKDFLKNDEKYFATWEIQNGYPYELEVTLIAEHPIINAAILKVNHPFDEEFPYAKLSFQPLSKHDWVFLISKQLILLQSGTRSAQILEIIEDKSTGLSVKTTIPTVLTEPSCPVFNLDGDVIGFVDNSYADSDLAQVQPIEPLKEWIDEVLQQEG